MLKEFLQRIIANDMTKRYLGIKKDTTWTDHAGKVHTYRSIYHWIMRLYIKLYGMDLSFFSPPPTSKAPAKVPDPLPSPAAEIKILCKNCGMKDTFGECKRCGYPDKDSMILYELKEIKRILRNTK